MSHGKRVGTCHAGDLIGEVTVLSGDEASATVILEGPARFWCAPAAVLRPSTPAPDDVRHALDQGIPAPPKAKPTASTARNPDAGGGPAVPDPPSDTGGKTTAGSY